MSNIFHHTTQLPLLSEEINASKRDIYGRMDYRLSKVARHAIELRMAQENYGLRGKSRWIQEAVDSFLALEPGTWQRIIVDTEQYREPLVREAVNLTDERRIKLWRASIDACLYGASLDDPVYLEISIASVIRAAIMWRLGKEPVE